MPGICVHLVTKYCHDQLMEEHQEPEAPDVHDMGSPKGEFSKQ